MSKPHHRDPFCIAIAVERERQGVSYSELAKRSGQHRSAVIRYLNGTASTNATAPRQMNGHQIHRLLRALGVDQIEITARRALPVPADERASHAAP